MAPGPLLRFKSYLLGITPPYFWFLLSPTFLCFASPRDDCCFLPVVTASVTPPHPLVPFQFSNTWLVILYIKFFLLHEWYGFCFLIYLKIACLLLTFDLLLVFLLFHVFPSNQINSYSSSHPLGFDTSHASSIKTSAQTILFLWTPTVSSSQEDTPSAEWDVEDYKGTLTRAQKSRVQEQLCYTLVLQIWIFLGFRFLTYKQEEWITLDSLPTPLF